MVQPVPVKHEFVPPLDDFSATEEAQRIVESVRINIFKGVTKVDLSAIKDPVVRALVAAYEKRVADSLFQNAVLEQKGEILSKVNATLSRVAYVDGLTKVGNRRFFNKQIRTEISRAIRHKRDLSVLLIDVDHFKRVNDTYGHPIGDRVLKSIAKILRNEARDIDYVCRYGGEEFVIILPETSKEQAVILAKRISRAISEAKSLAKAEDGTKIQKTVSIGVSGKNFAEVNEINARKIGGEMVRDADANLYFAKESGRDKIAMNREIIEP